MMCIHYYVTVGYTNTMWFSLARPIYTHGKFNDGSARLCL